MALLHANRRLLGAALFVVNTFSHDNQAAKRPKHVAVGQRPTEQDQPNKEAVKRRQRSSMEVLSPFRG